MVPCLVMLQVQQQRVTELTLELQETNNKLDECRAQKGAADQRITDMMQELENSAGSKISAQVYNVTCFLVLTVMFYCSCFQDALFRAAV